MFNQGDDLVVGGIDVVRQVVTDEVDIQMDGIDSDED